MNLILLLKTLARTCRILTSFRDGQMPKMDGYEASKAIRLLDDASKSSIKTIAPTASAFKGDRERCLSAGMDGYLAKVNYS